MKNIKVLGTVSYMGGIMFLPEPFAWSWSQMVEFNHRGLCEGDHERIHYDRARLGLHDYARNELCGRMEGDFILMLDTDMSFEPDFAARLVRTMYKHDLDVVTGLYQFKTPPHNPVLYQWNATGERYENIGKWDVNTEGFQVSSAGAGCLLIRRRALERIRDELRVNPFNREGIYGEDHSFFRRLEKLGIPAYCAWKVQAKHMGFNEVDLGMRGASRIIGEYPASGLRMSAPENG